MNPAGRRGRFFFRTAAVAVVVACALCYANTFDNKLVVGDLQFIVENPAIKTPSVLWTAFTKGYWWVGSGDHVGAYYRPLNVLLDAWDHLLWGDHAAGYHFTNALLHLAVSWLVLLLAAAWSRSSLVALGAGLLFAVHPIHVDATSYVSARSAPLCTGFYVGAVLSALRYRRGLEASAKRARLGHPLLLCAACYAGALLSMEAAITLPLVLLAVLWPPRGATGAERWRAWVGRSWRFGAGVLAVTASYFAMRRLALGGSLSSQKDALWQLLPPIPALLTSAKIFGFYFEKLFVPTELSYVPPFVPVLSAGDASGLVSLAALLGLAAFALFGSSRLVRERAALGWVFVTLVPVSGIVPLDHFVRAHYAYLPSVAFCILVPMVLRRAYRAAIRKMPTRTARLAFGGGFGVLLAVYGVQTAIDNMAWQDSESLYARVLELEPDIPDELFAHQVMTATANRFAFVHLSVGATLANDGQCNLAISHYERARWLTRQRSVRQQAQQLEADCLLAVGEDDRALALYLALADAPTGDSAAAARVGLLYVKRGDKAAARPYLAKACERGAKPACEALARFDVPAEPARP